MATTEPPNTEMTAEITKEEQTEPQVAANTSVEPAATTAPVLDTGVAPGTEAAPAPLPEQHQLTHVPAPEVPTDVDTSAMIAEAGK